MIKHTCDVCSAEIPAARHNGHSFVLGEKPATKEEPDTRKHLSIYVSLPREGHGSVAHLCDTCMAAALTECAAKLSSPAPAG